MSTTVTVRPFAEYQLLSPEKTTSLIVADLLPNHLLGRRTGKMVFEAHGIAQQIADFIQHPNFQDNVAGKLAERMCARRGYMVAYEGPSAPDSMPYILAFALMENVVPGTNNLGQLGITARHDARQFSPFNPEHPHGRNLKLLAAAALLHGLARRLPGDTTVLASPHSSSETRSGYLWEEAGLTPVNGVPWCDGGVVSASATDIACNLEGVLAYDFLRNSNIGVQAA